MNPHVAWQSDSYPEARKKFLDACLHAPCELETYVNPLRGPAGRRACNGTLRVLDLKTRKNFSFLCRVFMALKDFSGSAAQIGWIKEEGYASLPNDTACLLIHMINPYGAGLFAARYTEG